jgi:para-nitrobenzyl esterase
MTFTPLAKGLFRGAINESGVNASVSTEGPGTTLAEGEKMGMEFMEAKGATSLADLRRMSWQQIIEPVTGPDGKVHAFRFGDVIDGYVFPETARETYDQGRQNDVPTITGNNLNDNGGPAPHPDITLAELQKQVDARYDGMSGEFFRLYPATDNAQAITAYMQSTWDITRSSAYEWSVWRGKTAKTPVYTYFWDHTLPGPDAAEYGAFHTSEVPYVLDSLDMSDRPFTAKDYEIAGTMSSYWANFIKTGDPNGPGLAHWYSTGGKPWMTMELGDKDMPIPVAGDKAKEQFFEEYFSRPHPIQRP